MTNPQDKMREKFVKIFEEAWSEQIGRKTTYEKTEDDTIIELIELFPKITRETKLEMDLPDDFIEKLGKAIRSDILDVNKFQLNLLDGSFVLNVGQNQFNDNKKIFESTLLEFCNKKMPTQVRYEIDKIDEILDEYQLAYLSEKFYNEINMYKQKQHQIDVDELDKQFELLISLEELMEEWWLDAEYLIQIMNKYSSDGIIELENSDTEIAAIQSFIGTNPELSQTFNFRIRSVNWFGSELL